MSKKGTELRSSVVSVLIGHVFGVSAENVNIPFPYAWIASPLVGFRSFRRGDFICEVCFSFWAFFRRFERISFYAARHVLCAMAARPRATFAHKKTVRLIVDEGMDINALEIARSLPDFQEDITGIVPNFGGKCFDITLRSTDAATRLATSGFDYGPERKPLKLLGAKTIHVSVFVAVEFPDEEILNFLKHYGQLKSENLRRLRYNEDGFRNIERGIRVAEFIALDRDLPRKVVTQGLEIFFKYSGQPITCYRCGSTDHVVKNCPKQRSRFGHLHEEDRVLPGPPSPPETRETQMESESSVPSTQEEESSPIETPSTTPELYSGMVSRDLFAEPSETSRKRPPPSPEKSGNPEPKKAAASTGKPETAAKPRRETPAIKFLKKALHQAGSERTKLIHTVAAPLYYRCRGLYLQHKYGDLVNIELNNPVRRTLKDPELDAWHELHRKISQDAFAELIAISEEMASKYPALFTQ